MNVYSLVSMAAAVALLLLKFEDCIFWYLVFSFVMPVVRLGELSVSFEILAFLPLCLSLLLNKRTRFRIGLFPQLWAYALFGVLCSLVSITFFDAAFSLSSLVGVLRFVILSDIAAQFMTKERFAQAIRIILMVNCVFVIAQLVYPASASLTAGLYAKESASALLSTTNDSLNRLTGTFNNTLPSALFNLFALNVFLSRILYAKSGFDSLFLAGSLFCGFMGASKTFIAGLILSVLAWIILAIKWRRLRRISSLRSTVWLICIVIVGAVLFGFAMRSRISAYLQYYIDSLFSGEAFISRFGEGGAVSSSLELWGDHAMTGVGFASLQNEFVGDSQYIVALHTAGIFGLLCILSLLASQFARGWRAMDHAAVVNSMLLLAISTSGTTVFSLSGIFMISYLYSRQGEQAGADCVAHDASESLVEHGLSPASLLIDRKG